MNNSSDFMMYLQQDKLQRMRQDTWMGQDYPNGKLTSPKSQSPFARVRSTVSTWADGARNRDTNPS